MASWNTIKEAARALKGQMSKNARNTAKYQEKKERGPVKAFFHITKNENVPAIEQQGLLTNHPNANINSANHPFRKHGTDAGGVWVTTEPTAFPVYGTTIGGKGGNAEARADALSTIKIEVPLPELAKMKAVQDPYGKNILRKGNDPRAIQAFPTWSGKSVPTTVFINDIKPEWLKNIGYLEEFSPAYQAIEPNLKTFAKDGSWELPSHDMRRSLNKADFRDLSGFTGHRHGFGSFEKSPQRLVEDYLNKNHPITDRLPVFPKPEYLELIARRQGASSGPKYVRDGIAEVSAPNEDKRYSWGFIPAGNWTEYYHDYIKPGESIVERSNLKFAPGAISRGMGGSNLPPLKDRTFNWNKYKQSIAKGNTPAHTMFGAAPNVVLDWDNIVYKDGQYGPAIKAIIGNFQHGAISRGNDKLNNRMSARAARVGRRVSANMIRNERLKSSKYLSRNLGRQPTAEEIEHWSRAGIWNGIEAGDIQNPWPALNTWADKADWDIVDRLSEELFKRMGK